MHLLDTVSDYRLAAEPARKVEKRDMGDFSAPFILGSKQDSFMQCNPLSCKEEGIVL